MTSNTDHSKSLVFVQGYSFADVKKALEQWIVLYLQDLPDNFEFYIFSNGMEYRIELSKEMNNDLFNFLINYLTYPENFKGRFNVSGFTVIKDKIFPKHLLGTPIMLYVPVEDDEYDNVYGVTENHEHIKIDFGGKVSSMKSNITFNKPEIISSFLPEIITVKDAKEIEDNKIKNKPSFFNLIKKIFTR